MRLKRPNHLFETMFFGWLILVSMSAYAVGDSVVYRCPMSDGKIQFSDVARPECKVLDLPGYVSKPVQTAHTAPTHTPAAKPLTIVQAKEILERDLRDPEATHYRNVFVSKTGDVCGRMNAKNGLGGYVGYIDFLVRAVGGAPLTLADTDRWTFAKAWEDHCKHK
jgi:hypothetical protein